MKKKPKTVLYGAGAVAKRVVSEDREKYNFVGYTESEPAHPMGHFLGLPYFDHSDLVCVDLVLVASSFHEDITPYLRSECGLNKEKIMVHKYSNFSGNEVREKIHLYLLLTYHILLFIVPVLITVKIFI